MELVSYEFTCTELCWRDAMSTELDSLLSNETWDVVDLPDGKQLIGCKWVYKIKRKFDGSVE